MPNLNSKGFFHWILPTLTLFALTLSTGVVAQTPNLEMAPLNPEFAAFQKKASDNSVQTTAQGPALGYVPPAFNRSYLRKPSTFQPQAALPATFDLRGTGRLSPVKNQLNCGSCWTFATYACLEANLWPGEEADFSENNMKNTHGFDWGHGDGGNADMAAAYLLRWSGPVDEADDPYDPSSGVSPVGLPARKHIQEYLWLPNRTGPTDNTSIKSALMQWGPIHTSIYWDSYYYNPTNSAYYCNSMSNTNHAVVIVGWDDSYDRNKFKTVPPGDGAFIIRNSWGQEWGEAGYFYMSYYSTHLTYNTVFKSVEPLSNYYRIYQYDPLGCIGSFGFGSTSGWGANVFTASGSERLAAVGLYALAGNTTYEIRVYRGVASTPETGTLVQTVINTIPTAGFHTIPLSAPVTLNPGEKFSIAVRFDTPGYNYPVAMEYPELSYSSDATANPGESYYSSTGSSWADITGWRANTNICIKAYTQNQLAPTAVISYSPPFPATGEEIQFSALGSSDPDGSIDSYHWDLDNDGYFDDGNGNAATITFTENGIYHVRLRVVDNDGYEDVETVAVTVGNRPPVAALQATPEALLTNELFTFDASASSDPDGTIAAFAWDLDNDGQFDDGTGAVSSHAFGRSGQKTVRVQVTDDDGAVDVASVIVTAKNRPPVAKVTASPGTALTREWITFSASGSSDSDGTISGYAWDFDNDGQFDDFSGITTTYLFSNDGTYQVHVRVTDNNGATAIDSISVTISNRPPSAVVSFSPAEPVTGESITFKAWDCQDADGIIKTYSWDLDNDGLFDDASGVNGLLHSFDSPGIYRVSIHVTDDDGASDTASVDVTVRDISEVSGLEIRTELDEVHLSWINPSSCWAATRIVRRTDRYPDSISDGTLVYEGPACAAVDADLDPGAYFYRVFTRSQTSLYSAGITGTVTLPPSARKKLFFRNGLPGGTAVSAMSWSGDMLSNWNTATFSVGKGFSGRTSGFWLRFPDVIGGAAGQIPISSHIARARLTLSFRSATTPSSERAKPRRLAVYRVPDPDQLGTPHFGTINGIRSGLDFLYRDHRPGINRPWKTGAANITALLDGEQPVCIAEFIPERCYDDGYRTFQLDVTDAIRQWVGEGGPAQPNQGLFITIDGAWLNGETVMFWGVSAADTSLRPSLEIVYDTAAFDGSAPQAVQSLQALPKRGAIVLSWQNPTGTMAGVKVVRKRGTAPISPDDGVLVYDGAGQSVTDTGIFNGCAYSYGVFVYDASRDYSLPSTIAAIPGTPVAPMSLTAMPSLDGVALTWSALENTDQYRVYRVSSSEGVILVGTTTNTQWHDRRVLSEPYSYWVVGVNNYGEGQPSRLVQCTPTGAISVPAVPFLLRVNMSASGTEVAVVWTDQSEDTAQFVVERRMAGGAWAEVGRVSAYPTGLKSFRDTGVTPGNTYEYRICALNAAGPSAFVTTSPVTTCNAPLAPSNLQWVVVSGTRVNLSWGDASSNETGYRVDICNLGGGIISSITLGANSTSCQVSGLTAGMSYIFVVSAFNGIGGASVQTEVVIMPSDPKN